jgi:hypothetical protein
MNAADLAFDPLLPWAAIVVMAALAVLIFGYGLFRKAPGVWGRALAFAMIALTLAGPNLRVEERRSETDVAVAIIDGSSSMQSGTRQADAASAAEALQEAAARIDNLELRIVQGQADVNEAANGTRMFQPLANAFADVPRDRRAGAFLITDGQVHDAPLARDAAAVLAPLLGGAPLHALVVGEADEGDRRIRIVAAPPFALVGAEAEIRFVVEDDPIQPTRKQAEITVHIDGVPVQRIRAWPGRETGVFVPIDHAGRHAVELAVEAGPKEVSLLNNKALAEIAGIRDRLRVLMVSGQPHAGERVWRNLLKSDPAVDLVHFTILRPPEKIDYTSTRELALIAFPIRELFERKLPEFDLILFDRYPRRDLIPPSYLANIVEHVRNGGALLEASDAAYADPRTSLAESALGAALPGLPTGRVLTSAFRPELTDLGKRHPITAPLEGKDPENWGRWLRQIEVAPGAGTVLMTGVDNSPLISLAKFGEGRVAQVYSDQIWLWARGYEGGGPHGELLRRLAHWLMREPELEEIRLEARILGDVLTVERFTVDADATATVKITAPDGVVTQLTLEAVEDGVARAEAPAGSLGLYRVTEGERAAIVVKGDPNGPEAQDLRADAARLLPVLSAANGAAWRLTEKGQPQIRMIRQGRTSHGRSWIGLRENRAFTVESVRAANLPTAWLALLLILAGLGWSWFRESRLS